MSVVRMQKIVVLAHRFMREEFIDALHKEGVMQISEAKDPPSIDHTEVNFREAELQFAIQTLKDVAPKEVLARTGRRPDDQRDVLEAVRTTNVRSIIDRLHEMESADTAANKTLEEVHERRRILLPWSELRESLNTPTCSRLAVRVTGYIREEQMQELQILAETFSPAIDLHFLPPSPNGIPCVAIVWSGHAGLFEERITALGWMAVQMPLLDGTAQEILNADHASEKNAESVIRQNKEERIRLSVSLPALAHIAIFFRWLNAKQKVREASMEGFATMTLRGWVPQDSVQHLMRALRKVSPAVTIVPIERDPGEEVPVSIRNPLIVTPFESVTTLYGLPLSSEMDPTTSLAPFFALYFALCLTDGGYGMVLTVLFGAWLLYKKPHPREAQLPWLLFISGIVSILVAIPFGGWFGMTPEEAPAFMTTMDAGGTLWFVGQIWNLSTQEGINFLQYLSLILGITHIFFGIFLAGWHKWVHGSRAEAFWQHFTSHILLGSAIFLAVSPAQYATVAQWSLYAALALNIWGKGYGSPWFLRPFMGFLGLVNFALGLLSNTLSYLRILALGLVTGAIALAVNQVAVQMSGLFPPLIGIPVLIIILLGGHLVSVALNTLGAFIHSGRLQFIEFFGQFFEGGGREFSPFRRSLS